MTPPASDGTVDDLVLWQATVRALPLTDQLRVASAAGFTALSIGPRDVARWRASGGQLSDLLRRASDHGVRLSHLDALTRWAPAWIPDDVDDDFIALIDTPSDEFFRIADELGCESMTAVGSFPQGTVEIGALIDSFGALCDRAARHGIRCDLEFIPLWGIPDLRTAWTIVSATDRPNAGLMFDFWHFMRGTPDFDLLRSIPGERISAVQASDATTRTPEGRTDFDDCVNHRRPLGDGEFPIAELFRTLAAIGGLRRLGPEVFSVVHDQFQVEEMVAFLDGSLQPALGDAGVTYP